MKKMLISLLAVSLLLGFALMPAAQAEMKPVVTVSFSGYDKLMTNIGVIGQLGGNPNAAAGLQMMLQMMTQGKGLNGLDKAQPWGGVYLADDEGNSAYYVFVPVTDLKQLIETAQTMKTAEIKPDGDAYEIQAGPQTLYAKQKGKWAVMGQTKESLDKAPADPLTLIGELPKNYDLAVRLSVKNAPKQYREQFLAVMRMSAEAGMSQMPGETDQQFEIRSGMAQQTLQQMTTLANELDNVMLGLKIDPSTSRIHLDMELTAQQGTKLVDQFATMKPGKSKFAGFLMPNAALSANWIGTMSDADVARAKSNLDMFHQKLVGNLEDEGLSADELKLATKLLDDLKNFLVKTVETKKSDGGLTVLLDPHSATLVAGGAVADGAALDKILEQLVASVKESDPEAAKMFKLNAETHQGVRFNTLTLPVPKPEMKPFVGDNLEVVLGVAGDRVYLAAGRDAAKHLKSVIDQSKAAEGKDVPPVQISISVGAFAKFIAAAAPDGEQVKEKASELATAFAAAGDKDHVLINATPIERGVRMRLELEEGLLKALATMGMKFSPMGGGMPGGMPPGGMPPGGPVPPQQN